MLLSLGRISGIIVAGGYGSSVVDFLTGDPDLEITQLPNLPQEIYGSSMVAHNGTILLCGGRGVNEPLQARALLEHARKIGRSKMARLETARKFLARTRSSNENFGSLTSLVWLVSEGQKCYFDHFSTCEFCIF